MNYFDEFKDLLPDELETIKNIAMFQNLRDKCDIIGMSRMNLERGYL